MLARVMFILMYSVGLVLSCSFAKWNSPMSFEPNTQHCEKLCNMQVIAGNRHKCKQMIPTKCGHNPMFVSPLHRCEENLSFAYLIPIQKYPINVFIVK